MTETPTQTEQPVQEEQHTIDPNAPMHNRPIEYPVGDTVFDFNWTRIAASKLLYVIAGQKSTPDDTALDGMRRMLLKTVDSSQKGLLLDVLNDRANYTLAKKMISEMLELVTDNETIIGKPEYSQTGDIKLFSVPLITDGQAEWFDFKTDRNGFDQFQQEKEDAASDTAEAIHNFLSDSLADPKQKQRYNLLAFDERNFTLSVKVYSKVSSFSTQSGYYSKADTEEVTEVELGNILINQYRQSLVPPEELSEKAYRKAYRRALIAEARQQSSMEQAVTKALATILKHLK